MSRAHRAVLHGIAVLSCAPLVGCRARSPSERETAAVASVASPPTRAAGAEAGPGPDGAPVLVPSTDRIEAISTCRTVMEAMRGQYCATGCACDTHCFLEDEMLRDQWVPRQPPPPSCWCFPNESITRWCEQLFDERAIGDVDPATLATCVQSIVITPSELRPACNADDMLAGRRDGPSPEFRCDPACDQIGVLNACVQSTDDCPLF